MAQAPGFLHSQNLNFTALTGHTIRLLELPDVMLERIELLKLMQER